MHGRPQTRSFGWRCSTNWSTSRRHAGADDSQRGTNGEDGPTDPPPGSRRRADTFILSQAERIKVIFAATTPISFFERTGGLIPLRLTGKPTCMECA